MIKLSKKDNFQPSSAANKSDIKYKHCQNTQHDVKQCIRTDIIVSWPTVTKINDEQNVHISFEMLIICGV